jgi:uncharacterized protein (TIGR00290 family)
MDNEGESSMLGRTSMVERVNLSWSGGKDSALAFRELSRDPHYEARSLLTTVTEGYDRISMHGVRISLLDQQAKALGLPLVKVAIPQAANNEQYESRMREVLARERANGVTTVAFGDIFLEDIRRYREEKLSQVGMKAIFPIWKRDTQELALEFISAGFRAILTCVDSKQLDSSFVGRTFDRSFLEDLPSKVDPCGENGEFHTFVCAGPIFSQSIAVRKGEIVLREDRFYYCDLLPDVEE